MKKILLFLSLALFSDLIYGQESYWQQEVNFTINVSLNDQDNILEAFETIEYINHSPDTLQYIWFHIWPNAYKNDRTAFSEQFLKERRTDFYFSKPGQKGYINQLNFKVDGINATVVNDTNNIDIIQVLLPKPLAPGSKTIISTPFKVKLPYNFSRGGHVGRDYQITQWFPKPAVYDQKGWHPMPYLDQGEFYSEFGNFDVEITVPSAYIVAATGVLQDAATLQELKEKGKHTADGNTKVWHYKQNNIHDFAWFASKTFIVQYDTAVLTSNKIVDVFSFYKPQSKGWKESIAYAKDGIRRYSGWLGDYPYSTCSVVQGSKNENSGGMEYPTITLITAQETGKELDATIVHEIGHNWFYGALATNERTHPWMDEGMNTFYQKRYETEKYPPTLSKKKSFLGNETSTDEHVIFETLAKIKKDQPIETSSTDFTTTNYALAAYYKTSWWMKKLEDELGRDQFDKAMHSYYSDWKFRHPYPDDFKTSLEKAAGKNLDSHFSLLNKMGSFDTTQKKSLKPAFVFNSLDNKHNYINLSPALGYNYYDKGMIGGMINNYTLPLPKLQYLAGVLYGTGSKKLNGFGRVSYNVYKRNYHVSTALSYNSYSQNDFTTADNTKLILGVKRWVPSVKLTLFDKDSLSTRRFVAQWKTFLLNEGALDFKTIYTATDTFDRVTTINNRSYINRLSLSVSDNRVLFPYSLTVSTDQGKDFIKTGLTGKMFFNYSDGKSGMSARFFAGKLFYLKPATTLVRFRNDRYFLNMSGPTGYEDYTYSDYFIGRNEFEGWQSQQVMERDGFFKVNTALLGNKVGKTDDWLMSLNLSSDLPDNINPLSILPIKIPLKIFADVGTYAEAWKENPASGRFIYDAGIQIPLFHSLIDIYIPIVYSKVYRNYYKSTITEKRFLKTIAFTINISKLKLQDVLKDIPL
ncbi:M1 family metallopeptidase [Segetibacter aerophilus]|uniref:M1 family metallopeptidase n=1 Tax=Segetibacter aerophilus TaxID=670293 RepID=UPI0014790AFD|nr:M1 family metallopeptidase [Segetibacter aerophilus]